MSRIHDFLGVIRGLQSVGEASLKLQERHLQTIWKNSSIRTAAEELRKNNINNTSSTSNTYTAPNNLLNIVSDGSERVSAVLTGMKEFAKFSSTIIEGDTVLSSKAFSNESFEALNLSYKGYKSAIELKQTEIPIFASVVMEKEKVEPMEEEQNIEIVEKAIKKNKETKAETEKTMKPTLKAIPNPKKQSLSESAKQRTVPSSRISRMVSFGSLAAGLGIGTAAEYARRAFGGAEKRDASTLFLSPANMDRIVDTLCKVRGAALKIGQLMSIQDESVVSPELASALARVRKSADFMPNWQVEGVLKRELGEDWRNKIAEFDIKPFAAASIGQVHLARTLDGKEVAMKIQYPGVAKGIESDIDNLVGIMNVWNVFPKGMFVDNLVKVAKRELAWEVDYIREAECTKKFRDLVAKYPYYFVPKVIDELSTRQILSTELIEGIPADQCADLPMEDRKYVAEKILELCLREIIEFRYMQTDPNWANFFYNPITKQILLLDFGASRSFSKDFMDIYVQILKATSENDRETVLQKSRELGFLTGYESKEMEEAHTESVMILGEMFRHEGEYDYANQDISQRIQDLIPTMLSHRLCPPPEEIYSLHRKLSGAFLLYTKYKVSIDARKLFLQIYDEHKSS